MVAQLMFETYVLQSGWDAYRPVREDSQCDLLVDRWVERWPEFTSPIIERVQVKRVYMKGTTDDHPGFPTINLTRKNGDRYDIDQVDFIAAVNVDTGCIWVIPFEKLWDREKGQPIGRLRVTDKWNDYIVKGTA
jgi:hypothetical protein